MRYVVTFRSVSGASNAVPRPWFKEDTTPAEAPR